MKQYINKNHPDLKTLLDYRKNFPVDSVDAKDVEKYLQKNNYIITGKIDGELALIHYSRKDEECFLLSRNGRVRTDLPVTYELKSFLDSLPVNDMILVGELYVENEPGSVMPYPNAISILRAPRSIEDEKKIRVMIFDVISVDNIDYLDKPIFYRINFVQRFKGTFFRPVVVFDTKDFEIAWNTVLKNKELWEGLVIVFEDGRRIKVKPTITVDLAVVGVEISDKDPRKMKALLLAYMNKEGLFIFDSKVGSGFSDEEREEWLKWALENEVSREKNVIYVNPYNEPRIVEVEAREIHISEGPCMKFDKKNEEWVFVEDHPVGTLRQPSFKRIREDKRLVPEDLRITQVIPADLLKKSEFVTPVIGPRYSFVVFKDKSLARDIADLFDSPIIDNVVQIDVGNDVYKGFKPGDRVVSITKGVKGTIIDYEQVWCPSCSERTVPIPRRNFPMFSVFYVCPKCKSYLERTDVDYLVCWDSPIDEGYLYVSEVHPTEIKRAWLIKTSDDDNSDEVIIKSEYATLTKNQIKEYFEKVKSKLPKGIRAFIVLVTEKGPVLRRYLKQGEPIVLTDEVFDKLNHGRTVEFHKVIDSKQIDYFFVDIDPRENVPFSKTKKITKDLFEFLQSWDRVKDLAVQFSGNRGFYILGKLIGPMGVDDLRTTLINLLEEFVSTYGYSGTATTGIAHDPNMIRLDVSTLRYNGSIKLPYSLSWKTGLVSIPVDINKIDEFEKEDATIDSVLVKKTAFKQVDLSKLVNYEGRFVIQEHFSYKRNSTHLDLRLEVPLQDGS